MEAERLIVVADNMVGEVGSRTLSSDTLESSSSMKAVLASVGQ